MSPIDAGNKPGEEPAVVATVAALFVGKPQTLPRTTKTGDSKTWRSAIFKTEIERGKRLFLDHENFEGDYQANRKYHGGPDKAVCVYFAAHYPFWQEQKGPEFVYGAFGENITLGDGLTEDDVCVGDLFQLGEATVEVSQPRQPCANIGHRWNDARLPLVVKETGKTGFYLRVLSSGQVGAGDAFALVRRRSPDWSIARCNYVALESENEAMMGELRAVPHLSNEWKDMLAYKMNVLSHR